MSDASSPSAVEVTVVVPSVGRSASLARCLRSLRDARDAFEGIAQIVVVAGGYDAATLASARELGAEIVDVTPMPRVSAARNLGARRARGRYLIFLDDDNTVDRAFLRELIREARVGGATMLAPAMYYGDEPTKLWCVGVRRTPYLLRTIFETRLSETSRERVPSEGFPNCFLVSREQFEAVGGFDEEHFPQHFEESDLAQRLRARFGSPAFGVPAAKVWHHLPPGLARLYHIKNPFMAFQCARARAVYTGLYGTPLQWLIYSAFGQFAYAAIYLAFILAGRRDVATLSLAYARGVAEGWRSGSSLRHSP